MNRLALVSIASLAFTLASGGSAVAQLVDPRSGNTQIYSGIDGYWAGYVLCDTRGWAVFHHIETQSGRQTSQYRYYGETNGTATVDIFSAGQSFLFDAQEVNVYDYEYSLQDGALIGVGRGQACSSRLLRIPESDFNMLK